ncbi:ribonuclease J [Brachyspira aalborgi]|jgi:ribonuclease J|uniref:Ribonuclease J n=1 Tax=Brachyspira aalborgi TaxID=29522 RepID=A0A5C8ETD8_9SPIR|nr:ribonuclease J [Brachyspira aalborgi]MBS4763676.1 ribonuclease J [Brachyspira sp.]CCY75990.1 rNA-metabolising metallo-beta-lactamase [Brachyspira sp. CAG:700]TXJ33256.1 ribonuclease J [Brachyspira aalborgi]TXJ41257.1 ribonuclease J [Brachyspira aalborgi]TXJ57018.1 ribonuclease J [Brachyspira aalborgi]
MNDNNDKIRIIPLGGVQEIGMNMTVIEYGNELIIIDCGFMFPRYHMLGIDYVIPDTSYLKDKNIIGLILTHGHEDHIGAIPHFLRNFPNIKIYGTRLTAAFLKAKLSDYKNEYKDIQIYELEPRNKIKLGINFEIEFIRVNHSIPDGVGVAIKTPLGIIIHTGDFKIDLNPTTDRFIDLYKFAEYGEKGVLLLLADSTNCQREGFSISESVVQSTIIPLFAYKDGMIIAAVFASSIERIQDLVTAAKVNNKYITFSGRSLIKYTKIAEEMGYLNLYDIVIPIDKINRYPREKIVCLTTGTQGEPYSSLSLIAAGSHRHIKIEDGDMVIFSSSIIPGNEMVVTRMINNLFDLGAKMVGEDKKLLHVSGHASSEDLKLMYRLVKPKYFIPIHGEKRHLISHINLVENLNGLNTKGFLLYNGNVLEIDKNLDAKLSEPIEIRNIYVDGKGVGDLEESIFHDREQLSLNGVVAANVIIKKNINGNYDIKIDTESKGFIYKSGDNESLLLKTEELKKEGINSAMESVKKLLSKNKKTPSTIKYEVREALRRKYMQIIGREPVIFVSLYIDDIIEENKEQLK